MFPRKKPLFPKPRIKPLFGRAQSSQIRIPKLRMNPQNCKLYPWKGSSFAATTGEPLPYGEVYAQAVAFLRKLSTSNATVLVNIKTSLQAIEQGTYTEQMDSKFDFRKGVMLVGCIVGFFAKQVGGENPPLEDVYKVAIAWMYFCSQNLDAIPIGVFPPQSSAVDANSMKDWWFGDGGNFAELLKWSNEKNVQPLTGQTIGKKDLYAFTSQPQYSEDDQPQPESFDSSPRDLTRYENVSLEGAADAKIQAFLRNFSKDGPRKNLMKNFAFNIRYNGRTAAIPSADQYEIVYQGSPIPLVKALYGADPISNGAVIVLYRRNGNAQVYVASRNTVSNLGKKSKQPPGKYWVPIVEMESFPQGPILVAKGLVKNGAYTYKPTKEKFPCCAPHTGFGAALIYARNWRASKLRYQQWPIFAFKVNEGDDRGVSISYMGIDPSAAAAENYAYSAEDVWKRYKEWAQVEEEEEVVPEFDPIPDAFSNERYGFKPFSQPTPPPQEPAVSPLSTPIQPPSVQPQSVEQPFGTQGGDPLGDITSAPTLGETSLAATIVGDDDQQDVIGDVSIDDLDIGIDTPTETL